MFYLSVHLIFQKNLQDLAPSRVCAYWTRWLPGIMGPVPSATLDKDLLRIQFYTNEKKSQSFFVDSMDFASDSRGWKYITIPAFGQIFSVSFDEDVMYVFCFLSKSIQDAYIIEYEVKNTGRKLFDDKNLSFLWYNK